LPCVFTPEPNGIDCPQREKRRECCRLAKVSESPFWTDQRTPEGEQSYMQSKTLSVMLGDSLIVCTPKGYR